MTNSVDLVEAGHYNEAPQIMSRLNKIYAVCEFSYFSPWRMKYWITFQYVQMK